MAQHSSYWSCSAFADWLRGTKKPNWGTGGEWRTWEKEAKAAHPWRHWLAEEALDAIQDFVTWPAHRLADMRYYINNRWISRTHALTAHSRDIKPGTWCDVGNRFLPCLFNELVDFVEIEQAWHHVMWDTEARKKYGTPWTRWGWLRLRTWRCPQAGLDYLDWAAGLTMDESWGVSPGDPRYGKPTLQAQNAREIKELYTWWKGIYPNRPDAHDVSGWTDYCASRRENGGSLFDDTNETPESRRRSRTALRKSQKIEADYAREDEAMMIRLIKVRQALWT